MHNTASSFTANTTTVQHGRQDLRYPVPPPPPKPQEVASAAAAAEANTIFINLTFKNWAGSYNTTPNEASSLSREQEREEEGKRKKAVFLFFLHFQFFSLLSQTGRERWLTFIWCCCCYVDWLTDWHFFLLFCARGHACIWYDAYSSIHLSIRHSVHLFMYSKQQRASCLLYYFTIRTIPDLMLNVMLSYKCFLSFFFPFQ